ncbi:hypothetical protein GX586_09030, partial [bacterium]|nr:hypothetical protein [bacterium]
MSLKQKQMAEKFFLAVGRHSVLIAFSVMFSFPFIWMVATSAKVDREMFSDERAVLPRAPHPRMASPYIDRRAFHAAELPG